MIMFLNWYFNMKGGISMAKMTAKEQVVLMRRSERKLRQDMHRPMVIPDKKKLADKNACRSFRG